MIHYSSTVTIDRPPRVVYDALLDPDLYSRWTDMVDVRMDPGEPHVGTRGEFRLPKGPFQGPLRMEIVELEPERRVVWRVTHPRVEWTAHATLRPAGAGTELTYAGDLALRGWIRLLQPLIAAEARKGEASEAMRLKALLEGAGERPTASAAAA